MNTDALEELLLHLRPSAPMSSPLLVGASTGADDDSWIYDLDGMAVIA